MSSEDVISSLKGKVLKKNGEWTPYNAELQMQSIKVLVKDPTPCNVGGGSFEDTMLLLEMVKEKQQKQNKELKANKNFKYTVDHENSTWTPYNSNLQMQGIKVVVDQPVKKISAGSVENTLLLLDIVREKQHADNRKQKDEMIRQMALEQKQKKEGKREVSRRL